MLLIHSSYMSVYLQLWSSLGRKLAVEDQDVSFVAGDVITRSRRPTNQQLVNFRLRVDVYSFLKYTHCNMLHLLYVDKNMIYLHAS
jgi:hypothetical protein